MLTNCLAECAHLTITVSQIERYINWSKIVIFSYPLAFDAPVKGVPVGTSPPRLVKKKLQWLGYQMVKKIRRYLYSFWRNSRTWRTDAGWQHIPRLCIALRGKNCDPFRKKLCLIIQLRFIARQHTDARYWYSNSDSLSVCPSVRLSVAFRYCMETA